MATIDDAEWARLLRIEEKAKELLGCDVGWITGPDGRGTLIHGRWTSPDDAAQSLVTALSALKAAVESPT